MADAAAAVKTGAAVGGAVGSVVPVVGTVAGGIIGAVGGALSTLFGKKQDKSTVGFDQFIATEGASRMGVQWPSKSQVVAAGQAAGWPADNISAIQSTYDQSTGTANEGDWKIAVTSLSPISVTFFKGAKEQFIRSAQASNAAFSSAGVQPIAQAATPSNTANGLIAAAAAVFGQSQNSMAGPSNGYQISAGPQSSMPTWLKPVAIGAGVLAGLFLAFKFLFKRKRR